MIVIDKMEFFLLKLNVIIAAVVAIVVDADTESDSDDVGVLVAVAVVYTWIEAFEAAFIPCFVSSLERVQKSVQCVIQDREYR